MSELINAKNCGKTFRRDLLTNASMLALLSVVVAPVAVSATVSDRPTMWIELGGQLERIDSPQSILAPPFFDISEESVLNPLTSSQRPSRYSPGLEGKITFMPAGTDWVFSAAVRYGRIRSARRAHYQSEGLPAFFSTFSNGVRKVQVTPVLKEFGDGQTNTSQSNLIIDFKAGRDVGLGLFGSQTTSVLSLGVRYAQFISSSSTVLHARPSVGYDVVRTHTAYFTTKYTVRHEPNWNLYTASVHAERSTHGLGPSVSWGVSVPVAGHSEGMTIALDGGINAAALFGRQRVREDHQTSGYHIWYTTNNKAAVKHTASYAHQAPTQSRSHSVVIPNVGGFAGVSLKFPNAKLSLGYRADFFFNAMDMGLDTRDSRGRNFYGPYATISIGLGG